MAGHWGAVRLFLLSWLLPSSIRNQAINQKHRHVTCCKKESRANHRYLCDLTSYILDLQIFFAMKCTHAQQKIQIKSKQNKTKQQQDSGRKEWGDEVKIKTEQQSSRAAGKERKAGEKVIFPAMLQDFRMIQLTTVADGRRVCLSLSLVNTIHIVHGCPGH